MVRTLGYYTKCTGTNPFRGDLNTASTKVSEASTELSDGASEISNDPGCDMGRYNTITNILSSMSSDNGVLDKISDVIGCWEIEPIFEKLLQSADEKGLLYRDQCKSVWQALINITRP